jgi:hypothetical protein
MLVTIQKERGKTKNEILQVELDPGFYQPQAAFRTRQYSNYTFLFEFICVFREAKPVAYLIESKNFVSVFCLVGQG